MASKNVVAIFLSGGMDGLNFLTPRDVGTGTVDLPQLGSSVSYLKTYRQAAPANILDYSNASLKSGCVLTAGSAIVTMPSTANLLQGMKAYGVNLPARRGLQIASVDSATQITLGNGTSNEVSYVSANPTLLFFGTAGVGGFSAQLFGLNPINDTNNRNLAAHWSQRFLWDTFNVEDNIGNVNKVKSAAVMTIGPLLKPLVRDIFMDNSRIRVRLPDGTLIPSINTDFPPQIQSHNDQQTTWQSSKTEGATLGTGGAIMDKLVGTIALSQNKSIASVTVSNTTLFNTGIETLPFSVSQSGLVRKIPSVLGKLTQNESAIETNLIDLFNQATNVVSSTSDFALSTAPANALMQQFQTILSDDNISQITDPSNQSFSFSTDGGVSYSSIGLSRSLKTLLRLLLANNPNRGAIATRNANTVTIATEISIGVANRILGSTKTEITFANHGLFTSNTAANNTTDSVIILKSGGSVAVIDTSIPTTGYKITLEPSGVNNKFFFTSTATGELINEPVSIRLKHNLTATAGVANSVFIKSTDTVLSRVTPYLVTSVIDSTSFTITTPSESGAFTPTANLPVKFKLIDVPVQTLYADVGGWDSHGEPNHSQLAALNSSLTYFNAIVERIVDANVVTMLMSEFGRNITTNSRGTDHGYGSHMAVFGKDVRGNKVYGVIPDLNLDGANIFNNQLLPAVSVSQYFATAAKWLGLTDAQVLQVFPDLLNWPANERNLGFLDPLV